MKKIIALVLVLTIVLNVTVNASNEKVTTFDTVYTEISDSGDYMEIIKVKNSVLYSFISDNEIINMTVSNNKLVDYAYRNNEDLILYSDQKIKLSDLGASITKKTLDHELKGEFSILESALRDGKLNDVSKKATYTELLENFESDQIVSAKGFSNQTSYFTSQMEAKGFSTFYGRISGTRYPQGIPATVKERGDLYVNTEKSYWAQASMAVGIVATILGVSSGVLMAAGVLMITAAGAIETAIDQYFDTYACKWNGGKWVELYSQGNYYQAGRSVKYTGVVGNKAKMLDPRYDVCDTYYHNDTELCNLAVLNY